MSLCNRQDTVRLLERLVERLLSPTSIKACLVAINATAKAVEEKHAWQPLSLPEAIRKNNTLGMYRLWGFIINLHLL